MKFKLGVGGMAAVALTLSMVLGVGALTGTFTEVDAPISGGFVSGTDINDSGQVVGTANFVDGEHAFVRAADGSYTELPGLAGATWSSASAINNDGDVVGSSSGTAVIWRSGGAPTDLGSLPGETSSEAVDISDNGWIVGNGVDTSQAWYIDPAVGTVEAIVPVAGTTITQVRAVNDDGVAVGRAMIAGEFKPFTWNVADGMTLLPEPSGEPNFEPTRINNSGQIVGHVYIYAVPDGVYHSYLLDPVRGYRQLTVDGYDSAYPRGISDSGWVVGWAAKSDGDRVPAAWNLTSGDATAFARFNDAAFTNEFNAVNDSGVAVGISREGDDFDRTYVGQLAPNPGPPINPRTTTPSTPARPAGAAPAVAVPATPTYTG